MTKEELEKENQKVKQGCHKWFMRWREVKREELEVFSKIEELEKENEELRNNGFTVSAMTEQQLKVAIEKGEQLEKENAELKKANQTLATMKNDMWVELEKKRAESQGITNRLHQLTKAKELLMKWVELFKPKGDNIPPTPIQVDTEQFLKEIEK